MKTSRVPRLDLFVGVTRFLGLFDDKDVKEVLQEIDRTTIAKEKVLGFHVIDSRHLKMLEKIHKGYSFLAYSLDFFFLGDKAREEMKLLRNKLKI